MPKNKKAKLISLYSVQIPILALAIAFLVAGSYGTSKYISLKNAEESQNFVLGDDDEGDSKNDSNDSGDDDKNDESNDDDKNDESNDEDKNDESNDEDMNDESNDESDVEDPNVGNSNRSRSSNEVENEDENELEDENEVELADADDAEDAPKTGEVKDIETEEIVINADGTKSKIKKVIRNGAVIKMKVETLNSFGTKVSEKEFESGDDLEKKEFQLKTYDAQGNEKTKFEFKNELGRDIKLKIRDNDDKLSLLEVYDDDSELRIKELGKEGEESKLSIKIKGNGFEIEHDGFLANTNFPLVVDDQTGLITVSTPLGEYVLKVLPEEIKIKIETEEELDDITSTDLLVGEDGLVYTVTGVKKEKLLGLFNVELNKILNYDSSTGDLLDINDSFMTKLLDLLSF